jgi:hypothetical protein
MIPTDPPDRPHYDVADFLKAGELRKMSSRSRRAGTRVGGASRLVGEARRSGILRGHVLSDVEGLSMTQRPE